MQTASLPLHSPTTADEAAKAVVQIYRCRNNNCDTAVGSGVIIHRSGIIATAYHVLLRNPANPNSGPFDDENDDTDNIVIALTMDVSAPAEPRFQARLVATRADQDLALLQIVRDLAGNPIGLGDLALPTLAIADVANLFDEEFRVLGYQTRSREPISVERVNFRRYENGGRLIAVNRPLEPGNSGGPVLLEAAGGYAVAGIVIRRRTTQGQLVPEGLVRTIGQLHTLQWTPGIPRAWGESVTTTVDQRTQAHRLQLGLSLNTIDLNDHRLRLLFYATDAETEQPWQPANAAGPLVLWADVRPQQVTGQQTLTLTVPTARLGAPAERLHFRLLIWDWNAGETLWVDSAGVQVTLPAIALADSATPTKSSLPTATSTATAAPTETATLTPAPTATPLPTFTPTPAPTPTDTAVPTPTVTDAPTHTPTATVTPTVNQTTAFILTSISAQPTPTPTYDPAQPYNITSLVELAPSEIMRLGRGLIREVAYAPNGQTLAVASSLGIWLYKVDSPDYGRLLSHTSSVWSVRWSPDGATLASGSWDGTVRIWDAANGKSLATLQDHMGVLS